MTIVYSGVSSDLYNDWNVLEDGLDDTLSGITYIFDPGKNIVLPGPNNTAPLYTIIDGGLDFL